MKKLFALLFITSAIATSLPANAGVSLANTDTTVLFVWLLSVGGVGSLDHNQLAQSNTYTGGKIGMGRANFPSAGAGAVTNKNNQFVYGGFLGGDIQKNLAMELNLAEVGRFYTQVGSTQYITTVDVFSFDVLGKLPINDVVQIFGKAGVGISYADTVESGITQNTFRFAPTYGMGVQYSATKKIGLRLGWDHYGVNANVPQGINSSGIKQDSNAIVVSTSIVYYF
jgi:opacity protein-like surface antigen